MTDRLVEIAGAPNGPERYTTPLSLTSQFFFFCGLPLPVGQLSWLRLPMFVLLCALPGGNSPDANIVPADPNTLRGTFDRAMRDDILPEPLDSSFATVCPSISAA